MNIGPPNPKRCSKKSNFRKSKMADNCHVEIVKCDISATVTNLIKFGTTMHRSISHPNLTGDQMFKNLKIQDVGRRPF